MPTASALIKSLARVAREQQRVIDNLQRLLPSIDGRPAATSKAKRLRCPRCERRFALPMNLGRHLAATHRRKVAARNAA